MIFELILELVHDANILYIIYAINFAIPIKNLYQLTLNYCNSDSNSDLEKMPFLRKEKTCRYTYDIGQSHGIFKYILGCEC